MLTRTVYVVKLQTCNLGCRNPSAVGRIHQDQVKWISCMFSRGLLKNSMFCVSPAFHEREMHLLNLKAFDFFQWQFFCLGKQDHNEHLRCCCLHDTTMQNCRFLLVYMFDTNFYRKCFLYILLNQFDSKSTLLLVKLKIFLPMKLLEFLSLLLKFEIMKKFQTLLRYEILNFYGGSFIFGEIGPVVNWWPSVLIKY